MKMDMKTTKEMANTWPVQPSIWVDLPAKHQIIAESRLPLRKVQEMIRAVKKKHYINHIKPLYIPFIAFLYPLVLRGSSHFVTIGFLGPVMSAWKPYLPSGYVKIAIENCDLQWIYPLNIVIFHSFLYVYQRVSLFHKTRDIHYDSWDFP